MEKVLSGVPPKARKVALKKIKKPRLPRHREFVAHLFVVLVLFTLAFSTFVAGYAVGRRETALLASGMLSSIQTRWRALQARGVVPEGTRETNRLTGRVRAVAQDGFVLEADPVTFDLFSDEPFLRTVVFDRGTNLLDVAADGSGIWARRPLAVGDVVAVSGTSNIRSASRIIASRVERFAR